MIGRAARRTKQLSCSVPARLALALVIVLVLTAAALPASAAAQSNRDNERCLSCHGPGAKGQVDVNGTTRSIAVDTAAWDHSLHSLLDCTSCHVGFQPRQHTSRETSGWFEQASLTACGNCHAQQGTMYRGSFHGKLVLKAGEFGKVPTCGDCHDAHAVVDVTTQQFREQVTARCEGCHGGHAATFLDTYHGKAFELGRKDAAACYDCHGAHQILPASDPRSTVSKQHIVATCAKCHSGANAAFASYLVHVNASSPRSSIPVFLVYMFYFLLIAVVFTFGGVHSVLYFWRGRRQGLYDKSH